MTGSADAVGATEKLVENAWRSYGAVVGHAAALQESNAHFAQDVVEALAREYRRQAEVGQAVARELVERAEESRGELRVVSQEPVEACLDLLYAPLTHYKEVPITFGGGRDGQARRGA